MLQGSIQWLIPVTMIQLKYWFSLQGDACGICQFCAFEQIDIFPSISNSTHHDLVFQWQVFAEGNHQAL
jgi:hypothetical protein